jgi:hypothetical protein
VVPQPEMGKVQQSSSSESRARIERNDLPATTEMT